MGQGQTCDSANEEADSFRVSCGGPRTAAPPGPGIGCGEGMA